MTKKIYILMVCILLSLSFTFQSDNVTVNNLVIEFVTTNGNGNNIYVDNFAIGSQTNYDLVAGTFNVQDFNYMLPGQTSKMVLPSIRILNAGKLSASGATITLNVLGSGYSVTKTVPSINSGQYSSVNFDSLSYNLNTPKNIQIYLNWSLDQNHSNDTLARNTVYYPGVHRKVVYEAFTSSTCGPCASMNPYLDAFIQSHFDSIVPVKHHVWWPAPGDDPMFLINQNQNRVRTLYYGINAVPTLMMDGIFKQVSDYGTMANLLNPYLDRRSKGAPLSLTVTDTRLPGDTIRANITLQIVSPLSPNGNFKLRVEAIERTITYQNPPGTNGETVFRDVFRWAYPATSGTSIPLTPGTYNYEFKYKRNSAWVDSMLYTSVFVQNDFTNEIMNCNKSRNYYLDRVSVPNTIEKSNYCNLEEAQMDYEGFQIENFEVMCPPNGWTLINPDDGFTWTQYPSANGPSFPGSSSVRISLFYYTETGQQDFLKTKQFSNIDPNDSVKFDWSHAYRTGYTDRLQVLMSTNGGTTYPYTLFDRSGTLLATAGSSAGNFIPSSASQWGRFSIKIGDVLVGNNLNNNGLPLTYCLSQNYPNPFNPVTKINFSIPFVKGNNENIIALRIYNSLGQLVGTLVDKQLDPGRYTSEWNASANPSGVYFYILSIDDKTIDTKKMILLK